ncbi:hypothetical protein [Pelagovum pacificum]|uniref:Uncharacterized protein n=1 Tax=Pelagovum pacificum TaxID=2588711 RepID=A0A5C5GA18_9RHOB|nr:hypothetical protein [Pelagovum pacificum]QQA42541.1 hypothetical protein I8N54_17410 [Pelagovum pacificum]TNY31625.1 hypothetical protein FHY64_16605 [Pelagovum pacificum]
MRDLIRPEVRTVLRKWSEVILAGLIALVGLWWGLGSFGIVRWIGWTLVVVGAGLAVAALQRMRFAQGGGGAGIVTIDERRVVYYGPFDGGVADFDLLSRLELDPGASGEASWRLTSETGETLAIPVNAEGADGLFDLFAALPGIHTEEMLEALRNRPDRSVVVWEAPQRRLH